MPVSVQSVDKVEDFGTGKTGQAKRWMAELDSAKRSEEKWIKSAEKTLKRYRDERDVIDDQDRKFNILWSNVETLKPAVYSKPPVPEVSRRFDTRSQVNRVAALIMERNLHFTVCEHSLFDSTLKQCVEDRLLPGRGTAWVRYVADMRPMYATRPSPLPLVPSPPVGAPALPAGPFPPPGQPGIQPPAGPPANDPGQPPLPPAAGYPPNSPPPQVSPVPQVGGGGVPQLEGGLPPTQPPVEQLPPGPLPMLGAEQPTPMPLTPPQPEELQNKAVTDDSYESQVISGERVCHDYVHWKDFRMSPSRTWEECCWVARRVFMTREVGEKRFGKIFKDVPLNYTEPKKSDIRDAAGDDKTGPGKTVLKKAAVWEIWSKDDLKVYWLCEDYPQLLDERPDLFQLDEFFPCPRPLLATTTSDSMIPIPDFCMYQDQARELDQITNRISLLTQALKVIGVYDKTQDAVQRLLTEGTDNTMIPVDNWAMFAEKGGLKGVTDFFPIEMVMNALDKLINARGTVKQDIYEITGIADIVRGASVASETATAQTIKERFANIRISELQKEVARFASDLVNMTAQLMTNFFQPETLVINADLADPSGPDFQYVPQAVQLVKDGKLVQHKISVSVDAITEEDEREQKEARTEFMQQFSNMLQQGATAIQTMPEIRPLFAHVMLWVVRGFKVGRDIEGEIEQQIEVMAKQGPPPEKPDPAQMKAQAEQQKMQAETQIRQQEAAAKQQTDQAELAMKQQGEQQKLAMEQEANQQELAFKQREQEMELSFKEREFQMKLEFLREEHALKRDIAQTEAATKVETAQIDNAMKAETHAQDVELARDTHAMNAEQQQETHDQTLAQQAQAAAQAKKENPNAK